MAHDPSRGLPATVGGCSWACGLGFRLQGLGSCRIDMVGIVGNSLLCYPQNLPMSSHKSPPAPATPSRITTRKTRSKVVWKQYQIECTPLNPTELYKAFKESPKPY